MRSDRPFPGSAGSLCQTEPPLPVLGPLRLAKRSLTFSATFRGDPYLGGHQRRGGTSARPGQAGNAAGSCCRLHAAAAPSLPPPSEAAGGAGSEHVPIKARSPQLRFPSATFPHWQAAPCARRTHPGGRASEPREGGREAGAAAAAALLGSVADGSGSPAPAPFAPCPARLTPPTAPHAPHRALRARRGRKEATPLLPRGPGSFVAAAELPLSDSKVVAGVGSASHARDFSADPSHSQDWEEGTFEHVQRAAAVCAASFWPAPVPLRLEAKVVSALTVKAQ